MSLHLGPCLTLLEAWQIAQDNNMHLISDGHRVVVSPIILPGWREVPMVLRAPSPFRDKPAERNDGLLDMVAA